MCSYIVLCKDFDSVLVAIVKDGGKMKINNKQDSNSVTAKESDPEKISQDMMLDFVIKKISQDKKLLRIIYYMIFTYTQ